MVPRLGGAAQRDDSREAKYPSPPRNSLVPLVSLHLLTRAQVASKASAPLFPLSNLSITERLQRLFFASVPLHDTFHVLASHT